MTEVTPRNMSLKYEDHLGLLHMHARKGFKRLEQAKVAVEYDDVFGEMSLTYAICMQKFDPNAGVTFPAYFGRACWNNFNKFAEKWINEQVGLKLSRIEDLGSDEDDGDALEWLHDMTSTSETPETILDRSQQKARAMRLLSNESKAVVRELISPSKALQGHIAAHNRQARKEGARELDDGTIKFICKCLNLDEFRTKLVRRELANSFGVDI